jgi:hypothetical protein
MSEKPMNKSRRDAVKLMLGGLAAVPVMNLVGMAAAYAEDLPHVDEATDPTAMALQYKHDATQANRVDKAGTPAAEQHCANCQFLQAGEGDWRPCQLFPGKAVNVNGWCASWNLKQG